jgi:hypothetical protein
VKGVDDFYKGMYGELTSKVYLGIPPKNGRCFSSPLFGIANVTTFNFSQSGWEDLEGIDKYEFFYSMDGGDIYLPIESNPTFTSIVYVFEHIYTPMMTVKIKCKATNVKGFSSQALT